MSFLAAERLIWLWVALPVIGFYILKARLRRRNVSTLLFWDQIFEEKRQRSLWQNLRHWLSLLLQLIFIGLIVLALTDPMSRWQQQSGQELILIIDNSASMQSVDSESGKSRLELAKEEAIELAQGLRAGDSAAVMSVGGRVQVVSGMTDFGPTVSDAVNKIQATDGPTRIEQAITAARRLSTDANRRRIVVISDACGQSFRSAAKLTSSVAETEVQSTSDAGNDSTVAVKSSDQDVYWLQVGSDSDNVALTLFQARRSTVDPLGYSLLVEISNFSDQKAEGRLKLELDGDLVDVLPYKLEADEVFRRTIQATSQSGGILTGTVDSEDGLAVDNVAVAVVPKRPVLPVTLVKPVDADCYYLKNVLSSVPLLELTEMTLDEYNLNESPSSAVTGDETELARDPSKASDIQVAKFGLTVFSSVVPAKLPSGPVLFVAPSGDGPSVSTEAGAAPAWQIGEELESALIAKQTDDSALLLHVKMQNVLVMGARDIRMAEGWQPTSSLLQTAEDANVLVSIERESGRVLVLSANLDSSDLPLRIAFPVMMTNAVNWFLRQSNEIHPAVNTGVQANIAWDQSQLSDSEELTLVAPLGNQTPVAIKNQQAITDALNATGIYCLTAAEIRPQSIADTDGSGTSLNPEQVFEKHPQRSQLVAVNLCSSVESDLRLPELPDQSERSIPASGWPTWLWAVLIASGFIVVEWGLFHRRVVA
ncbi:MAG: BatA and WFA domain-containing protein [Fuerstiella sp.]